ncbi:SGNH hydrolase domain-containing protein [Luteimonas arsenica]|uniref:SGNH hydrolase domain-containing protein n=1 Tax=Luteimonas arsenica TaxID=1586242 RepID=UPI0014049052|nr:acyltransferase family protein [Luteimonas arsenica]
MPEQTSSRAHGAILPAHPSHGGTRFLPEIQALRALAVMLVVVFHLWPQTLTGGYVGVDVFFVISGFLITSHLMREVERTGTVVLTRFWARRIARLLPAALLVLAVTLALVLAFMPRTLWQQAASEIGASALYLQNWLLAFNAIDYFAAADDPSPVQHYWSLSVEEQFYLVWPVVVVAMAALARGKPGSARHRLILAAISAIFVLSLAYSVYATANDRSFAYFSTFTHAWEFAAGGLLALLASDRAAGAGWRLPALLRALLGWAGFFAIFASAVVFTGESAFPGWIALLPVAGAIACIAWGDAGKRWDIASVLSLRPVQFTGDVSYSLYLWHWPVIVLFPYVFDIEATDAHKWLMLAASMLLAWATYALVENRFRWSPSGTSRRKPVYAFAAVVPALLVAACFMTWRDVDVEARRQGMAVTGVDGSCVGAAAAMPGNHCPDSHLLSDLGQALAARNDKSKEWLATRARTDPDFKERCALDTVGGISVGACRVGPDRADAIMDIALVGDSHAGHLLVPLSILAKEHGWNIVLYQKTSCRAATPTYQSGVPAESEEDCVDWKRRVIEYLAVNDRVDLVVTSNAARRYNFTDAPDNHRNISEGFRNAWRRWREAGKRVLVISDVPLSYTPEGDRVNVPTCISRSGQLEDPCAIPLKVAAAPDPMTVAATGNPDVEFLDLTPFFCDDTTCHFVVGGMVTHRDDNHITPTFSASLAPFIEAAVARAMR